MTSSLEQKRYLPAALSFSILVFLKHLFAPLALPFGIYFISAYCIDGGRLIITRFLKLVAIATAVIGSALGPFVMQANGAAQLSQIFLRLFPFDRGLVHTYWAPNLWAVYCFIDRLLLKACAVRSFATALSPLCGLADNYDRSFSSTTGVLGSSSTFAFLPFVSAGVCLISTVVAMLPSGEDAKLRRIDR